MLTMGCSGPTKSSLVNEGGGGNASVSSRKARYCAFVTQYLSIQKASSVTSRWRTLVRVADVGTHQKGPFGHAHPSRPRLSLFSFPLASFIFVSSGATRSGNSEKERDPEGPRPGLAGSSFLPYFLLGSFTLKGMTPGTIQSSHILSTSLWKYS